MSVLRSTLRSKFFTALAGSLCLAIGGAASAQVVEDKAPQPATPKVSESDKVKDAAPAAPKPANAASDSDKSSSDRASDDKPAADAPKSSSNNSAAPSDKPAALADPSKVGTDAPKAGVDAKVDANANTSGNATGADVNANTRTNAAAGSNQAGTAAQGSVNAGAQNNQNPANQNSANQGNRTFSNDPAAAAAGRVNAGINAGVNAANTAVNAATNANANTNADFGRVAAQIGLNFAAGAANALTLSTVGQNSIFANAGFMPNDQFVSIGGTPIANQAAFYRYLSTVPAGQRVPIVVMRNGRQQTLYWTPDQRFVQLQPMFREVAVVDAQPAAGHNSLGITLDENVTDAVIVADVAAGSPASNAGVRRGDQIVALNDQEVQSPAQFHEAAAQMPANSPARIAVARTVELQISGVQQTGAVVPATGRAVVQPAAPVGVVEPARPIAPARRFRFR